MIFLKKIELKKTMRIVIYLLLTFNIAFGQSKIKTDCNTIFVCIDSISYNAIFSNSYLKNTLFFCKAETTGTNVQTYSGLYLIGKSATLEFFQPQKENKIGNNLGDFGIEFKTRKLGQLDTIFKNSQENHFKVDTLTIKLNQDDSILPWYKELSIKKRNFELTVLEYQKEFLKHLDFNDNEISTEMTFEQLNDHLSGGKKYPRQFNKIKSVMVLINKNELQAFQQFCTINQMKKSKNSFYNDDFKIKYRLSKSNQKTAIKQIEVEFIKPQPQQTIQLSNLVTLEVSNTKGRFIFNK